MGMPCFLRRSYRHIHTWIRNLLRLQASWFPQELAGMAAKKVPNQGAEWGESGPEGVGAARRADCEVERSL